MRIRGPRRKSFPARCLALLDMPDKEPVRRALWDPRSYRMEETTNRALILLDQLMDRPGVDIEAIKRVANICGEEGIRK